ncbi:MAG: type II secretion system protein, partial [Acidimicrobiales bacterium]|nr:type II secretion system protein [Acidimicrobiales bacterium]
MARARAAARARGQNQEGMTLVEVVVAFTVLMIALVPLSYLFTNAVIQAGQSTNQQAALSIAEHWAETLSNTTPPVTASTGAVIVDTQEPPAGPAATFTPPTVTATSNNKALNTVTTINVTSTSNFAAASASVPQTAYVVTGTSPNTTSNQITYTSMTATSLTCPTTCSTSTNVMVTGNQVTQTEISTPTETRGGTTYTLKADYEWATSQNTGVISTPVVAPSIGQTLPQPTIYLTSVSNLIAATSSNPQTLRIPTTNGTQIVTYTGVQTGASPGITGVTGGTGTIASGNATQVPKPNLCTSGTPQLLKLRMAVSWGPNADVNSVTDSVMLNYPPSGVQTLGFLALQFTGDSGANDAQGNPWSERVTAIPVSLSGPENLTIYPDQYGCAFAQVLPGNYTVNVNNATSGIPVGSTYGSPSFVANTTGSYSSNVWSPPTTEPVGGTPSVAVSIGAVTRVDTNYSANYPGYDQAATVNFSYPSTTSVEDGVVCPAAGQVACIATGESAGSNGADISWLNSSSGTWSTVTLPNGANVTRVTSIACAVSTACVAVGYGSGGAVVLHGTTGSGGVSLDSLSGVPGMNAAPAQLNQITCPTATQCVATGTNSSGAGVVVVGTVGAAAGSDTWTAATLPANITSLSGLQCLAASGGCLALATTTTVGSPVILSGPVAGG